MVARELTQVERLLSLGGPTEDAKNYHAWSHRIALHKHFRTSIEDEIAMVERCLARDPRNNSAWAHRAALLWSDVTHTDTNVDRDGVFGVRDVTKSWVRRDLAYVARVLRRGGWYNESPWFYLGGLMSLPGVSIHHWSPTPAVTSGRPTSSEEDEDEDGDRVGDADADWGRCRSVPHLVAEALGVVPGCPLALGCLVTYLEHLGAAWAREGESDPIRRDDCRACWREAEVVCARLAAADTVRAGYWRARGRRIRERVIG